MVTVLEQNRSQFEKAPLGPLAEHVKLTEGYRDKFDILEAALGRPLLESFMVFSKRDKDTLLRYAPLYCFFLSQNTSMLEGYYRTLFIHLGTKQSNSNEKTVPTK